MPLIAVGRDDRFALIPEARVGQENIRQIFNGCGLFDAPGDCGGILYVLSFGDVGENIIRDLEVLRGSGEFMSMGAATSITANP
ncbi:hypothetical protein A0U91_00225 [Acetobacter persici]|uniref:Uncharacterized protein n=1 Tax=Acetobacter persici TaxID=1076596 RepID=A0A1U9LBI7_9PROT|nr:hypothetical protein A0U91_00225 [Acetobacter persici]